MWRGTKFRSPKIILKFQINLSSLNFCLHCRCDEISFLLLKQKMIKKFTSGDNNSNNVEAWGINFTNLFAQSKHSICRKRHHSISPSKLCPTILVTTTRTYLPCAKKVYERPSLFAVSLFTVLTIRWILVEPSSSNPELGICDLAIQIHNIF